MKKSTFDDCPLQVLEDAPEQALAVLRDTSGAPLDAVVWLSAHLASVQHVVHRAAERRLADGSAMVAELRHGAVRIERTLRLLEQLYSGDAIAGGLDGERLTRTLLCLVTDQADREHLILRRLAERLSAEDQQQLAASYQRALEHAPTRPHPYTAHAGSLGDLAYAINGWRDRVMDVLDSRHVPTPRPAHSLVKSGRWGDYVLGASSTGWADSDDPPRQ